VDSQTEVRLLDRRIAGELAADGQLTEALHQPRGMSSDAPIARCQERSPGSRARQPAWPEQASVGAALQMAAMATSPPVRLDDVF
jgi:hypothetical protein